MKKYRLKKDAPMDKAGTIFELHDDDGFKWLASDKCETQYPINLVDNFDEWFEEVSKNKEDKKMKRKKWSKESVSEMIHTICALLVIAVAILILFLFVGSAIENVDNQAQCESIGGRYGQKACWYNGSKIDVNKYVEEWK